jgi:hypothetical protein
MARKFLNCLARPDGFEPPTPWFEVILGMLLPSSMEHARPCF